MSRGLGDVYKRQGQEYSIIKAETFGQDAGYGQYQGSFDDGSF